MVALLWLCQLAGVAGSQSRPSVPPVASRWPAQGDSFVAKRNTILSVLLVLVLGVLATVVVLAARPTTPDAQAGEEVSSTGVVVGEDSHRLSTAPQGAPVFVEFLDFECESCRAAFPSIEKLRAEYEGQVSFVIRYFPIDSHANAMNAAKAVEAAAAQGKLEEMYTMMYETQPQWGEQQDSRAGPVPRVRLNPWTGSGRLRRRCGRPRHRGPHREGPPGRAGAVRARDPNVLPGRHHDQPLQRGGAAGRAGRRHREVSTTATPATRGTADAPSPGRAPGAASDGRWVAIALLVAGTAGALASAALIIEKVAVLADPTHVPACSINPVISCGSVMMSWQAELLGFPNPVLGLAGFPVVAASGAAILAGGYLRRWYWIALLAGSLAGVGLVHWLIFQSLYRIGALCPYCMVVWVSAAVTLVAVSALLATRGILPAFIARYAPTILIAWLAVVATLATIRFRDYWATLLF